IERYPAREIRVVETEARPQPVDFASILKHGLPPVPWILRGWLAEGDILTISGAPYSGKTTTAYALALALAHGTPWLGLQPTARVRVLIVDEEMGQRRAARLLLRSNGMKEPDRDWLRMFCEKGLNLTIGAARLEREIEDFRPDVTILDSMTKMLVGIANENDAMQVAPAFSRMKDLRAAYGTGFAVVDHCGKPREATVATLSPSDLLYRATRGSSVKQSEPDAIFLQSGAGLGLADLTQVKRRESGLISVRIGYTEDGEDGPIELSNRGTPDAELTAETRAARWIVAHLADVGEARRSSIVTAAKAAGFSDGVAERAVRGLRDRGEIEQPQRRAPYRLAQRLAQPEPGATLAQRDAFDAYAEHEETAAKPTRGFDCD
ncbi:MAG: AAA family ATPase, partial [Candidatus Eisenbacteria bacterium]|nr:AAA family ATPase [Candidatus Eisenbacteria bacterium]